MNQLTPIASCLQTVVHVLIILILLDTDYDQVGEVAVHLDLLLLQHGVFCGLCTSGQYHTCCPRFHRTAWYLCLWLRRASCCEFGVECGFLLLGCVQRFGELLVFSTQGGVCFCKCRDGLVEVCDFGRSELKVSYLLLEGFDYSVLVCIYC